MLPRFVATAVFVAALSSCDEGGDDECPDVDTAELACPAEIGPFETGACGGYPEQASEVGIDAAVEGESLEVTLTGVPFRDDNVICGFAERRGDEIDVLLQPCTLIPEGGVSKGDCWYASVAFEIDEVSLAGATRVVVLQRADNDSAFPPDAPREIAAASLP